MNIILWYILVKDPDKRFNIRKQDKEDIKEYTKRIKTIYQKARDKFGESNVYLISGSSYPPSKKTVKIKGQLYCPYCRKYRVFYNYDGLRRCHICGVSDSDFCVKKYNGIFKREFADYARKKDKSKKKLNIKET